jgi:NAD-dependent dihydropyrimidine dehydrogenase PreA subunit
MNLVLCFSPTNGTKMIAEYVADYLEAPLVLLTSYQSQNEFDYTIDYEYIVFCFPVYSQNIPVPVHNIISKLKAKYFVILATYGRMNTGNVLYEVSKLINGTVIGGAYIPTKHTYKSGGYFSDFKKLNSLLNRVKNNVHNKVAFPKIHKNLFASFFPNFRSRVNVKLKRTNKCINCNLCNKVCPNSSIANGKVDKSCIRCLSCYHNCCHQGLEVHYSWLLKIYLKKDKVKELIVY